jgi:copper chaperone
VLVETRYIVVDGMTCDHCANAVRAELVKLTGVAEVDVEVSAGKVKITGVQLPGDAELHAAIDEAGYSFIGLRGPGVTVPLGYSAAGLQCRWVTASGSARIPW